ncbi:hypothetical protein B9N43_05445 [Denitratisoma sp. DHT3]|nr:hypothetical protein B9N43_05445 [Denitratisoma sp. DHT3]
MGNSVQNAYQLLPAHGPLRDDGHDFRGGLEEFGILGFPPLLVDDDAVRCLLHVGGAFLGIEHLDGLDRVAAR